MYNYPSIQSPFRFTELRAYLHHFFVACDIRRQISLFVYLLYCVFDLDWVEQNDVTGIDEMPVAGKKDIHGDFGAYCYPGYRHSLCHGWSAGPASWLLEHVLGVQIVEPGCRAVKITPFLGDLEWVEGTFSTPYGAIKITHRKLPNGTIDSKIDAPRQVRIIR